MHLVQRRNVPPHANTLYSRVGGVAPHSLRTIFAKDAGLLLIYKEKTRVQNEAEVVGVHSQDTRSSRYSFNEEETLYAGCGDLSSGHGVRHGWKGKVPNCQRSCTRSRAFAALRRRFSQYVRASPQRRGTAGIVRGLPSVSKTSDRSVHRNERSRPRSVTGNDQIPSLHCVQNFSSIRLYVYPLIIGLTFWCIECNSLFIIANI